ncbi:MAG: anti-sigma factor antagonist [Actinomycetota bacterium]|jgi:anti-anti-sigma factor
MGGNEVEFSATAADGVVVVRGEIDLASAPRFEHALADALEEARGDLVVDLAGVAFMDSAGMNVLVRIFKTLDSEGRTLRLVHPNPSVRRALEIGGVATFASLG